MNGFVFLYSNVAFEVKKMNNEENDIRCFASRFISYGLMYIRP